MNYRVNINEELRMYFLTLYNISEIQKGIQSLHAVVRYGRKYGNEEDYIKWADDNETVTILNGGTSTNPNFEDEFVTSNLSSKGSMELHENWLKEHGIKYATFNEVDLNYATSGICFLVDGRIFLKKKYPVFKPDFNYTWPNNKEKDELLYTINRKGSC